MTSPTSSFHHSTDTSSACSGLESHLSQYFLEESNIRLSKNLFSDLATKEETVRLCLSDSVDKEERDVIDAPEECSTPPKGSSPPHPTCARRERRKGDGTPKPSGDTKDHDTG